MTAFLDLLTEAQTYLTAARTRLFLRRADPLAFTPDEARRVAEVLEGLRTSVNTIHDTVVPPKPVPKPRLCPGCNVHVPWEHRCFGEISLSVEDGGPGPCECPECKP